MDDAVRRAMERWPNVPAVYGWLRLDRRGRWHVKNAATEAFELIEHPGIVAFIGRNYARLPDGAYAFQNGPQRVFVALEYTPYVFRLDDRGGGLVAHTGEPAGALREARFDETGALLVVGGPGVGVIVDRDLPAVLDSLRDEAGTSLADEDVEAIAAGRVEREVMLLGHRLALGAVRSGDVARRFGFQPDPAAPM